LYTSDALDPDLAELALPDPTLTPYDDQHRVYLRMLDANAGGADWREVPGIVLHIDAERSLIGAAGVRQSCREC
jgi:hypothetical protein